MPEMNVLHLTLQTVDRVTSFSLAVTCYFIRVTLLAGLLTMFFPPCLAESGVFIFRQTSSHPESQATALRYVSVKIKPPITVFTLATGQNVTITPSQPLVILRDIRIQDQESISPNDAATYAQSLAEYQAAYKKYPNSRPHIKQQIADLQDIVAKLQSGNAWFEGQWVTEAEVKNTLTARNMEISKKAKKDKQERQLAPIEQRIQELDQQLTSLKAKVKETSDRNEKAAADYKKAEVDAYSEARSLLKQNSSK